MDTSPLRRRLAPQRVRLPRLLIPLLFLAVAAVGTGCVSTGTNPVSGNTRAYGYTWQEELKLGKKADKQIQGQYGVYENEELQRYVDEIAQDVLAESHMRRPSTPEKFRKTEFHFRVLDSPVINAFALPGGYVYVTRGLLAHLNNEAQLAVVLGHEIAHVAARHASQQAARRQFTKGFLLGGAVLGQAAFGGEAGRRIVNLGGTAAQLLSLRYSRGSERESDRLGVQYAVRAGYDAAEAAGFFGSLERKQKQSDRSIPTWRSTHPDPGARQQTVPQLAQKWKKRVDHAARTVDQDEYYAAIERMIFGKNPRRGFTEDGVFYHPELAFRFPIPSDWTVQNQPRQVVAVQPSQEAYVVFRFADADTPAAAARQFTNQDGLGVRERQSVTVNGYEAQRVLAEAETKKGRRVYALAYFISYRDQVYQFQGLTPAEQYDVYRSTLERTMTGFDRLRDPDKLNVQPARLAIRPASRQAAFRTFVDEAALPEGMTAADLAIVNQLELDRVVAPARPLKLPD